MLLGLFMACWADELVEFGRIMSSLCLRVLNGHMWTIAR